jgi:hypothetical protein
VLFRYFHSMSVVLANVRDHLADGAVCWLVLGDSRSTVEGRRWTIPTVDEIASIADHRGFRVLDRIPITVTREDVLHSRHAITRNEILQLSRVRSEGCLSGPSIATLLGRSARRQ